MLSTELSSALKQIIKLKKSVRVEIHLHTEENGLIDTPSDTLSVISEEDEAKEALKRQKRLEYARQYYKNNKEKIYKKQREYLEKHKDDEKYKDIFRRNAKSYYEKHKERILPGKIENSKIYYHNHRDEVLAQRRESARKKAEHNSLIVVGV